jgi:hypothetical protein
MKVFLLGAWQHWLSGCILALPCCQQLGRLCVTAPFDELYIVG